jgi:cytochrome c oxidase subunit 4
MSLEHIVPIRIYVAIFVTLLVMTAITTAVAFVDLGPLNVIVMLAIAFFKASLVILYFMHVRFTNRVTQLAAASGFAWLLIMFTLTLSDYVTRGIR